MADPDRQNESSNEKSSGSMLGRLLIVLFMGGVVAAECLFAYFWLPSKEQIAAEVQLIAQQAQDEASRDSSDEEEQGVSMAEVDLGSFSTTKHEPTADSTFRTDFHLWGTVAEEDLDDFSELFSENRNRFRNLVIQQIHTSKVEDLVENPGLSLIKRQFLEKSNDLLGKRILRSIVFADYTFVEL